MLNNLRNIDFLDGLNCNNNFFVQVPKGHVWLEGDNLMNSTDSRNYGPIPYGLIRGRVCLKVNHG